MIRPVSISRPSVRTKYPEVVDASSPRVFQPPSTGTKKAMCDVGVSINTGYSTSTAVYDTAMRNAHATFCSCEKPPDYQPDKILLKPLSSEVLQRQMRIFEVSNTSKITNSWCILALRSTVSLKSKCVLSPDHLLSNIISSCILDVC